MERWNLSGVNGDRVTLVFSAGRVVSAERNGVTYSYDPKEPFSSFFWRVTQPEGDTTPNPFLNGPAVPD